MDQSIHPYVENMHNFDKKNITGMLQKDRSEVTKDLVLSWRVMVCKAIGGYNVEVKVPSLHEDQTNSWVKIVSGIEKYVREAMPTQGEEEKVWVKPAAKAKPTLKPASACNPNSFPIKERKWIDFAVQNSKIQSYFQMSKFITNLLRHQDIGREEDAAVPYERIIEECKEKLSGESRYWKNRT